jgi:ketosteroid isomerase-like protein
MESAESEIRALLDSRSEAARARDIDRLMAHYAAEIVYFDVVPPLQYAGAEALRARFLQWFDGFQGAIVMASHTLNVSASADVAFAGMLTHTSGTLKNGHEVGHWVRVTVCCKRSNGRWLITHEHVSLPVDVRSRSAATDLVP